MRRSFPALLQACSSDYIPEEAQVSRKSLGYILSGLGIILVIVSAFADVFGLGGVPGFGWKQIVGAVAGVIVAAVGVWLVARRPA